MEDRIIEIVEDRAMLEYGLRVIIEAAERRALPEEAFLPTFNDALLEETFRRAVELAAGRRYDE